MFPGSHRKQRFPAGDGAGAIPRLVVVRDPGKQPAKLDGGRQFAALSERRADRVGFGLGNDEHSWSMARQAWHGKKKGCRVANARRPEHASGTRAIALVRRAVPLVSERETRLTPVLDCASAASAPLRDDRAAGFRGSGRRHPAGRRNVGFFSFTAALKRPCP